jgi:ribosomal protein L18E
MKNDYLDGLIKELRTSNTLVWKRVGADLAKSTRKYPRVNLSKIQKYSQKDTIPVIAGKVLSAGKLADKKTVVAYAFSELAIKKITASGGEAVLIGEYIKKNPEGKKVQLLK